MDSPLNYNLVFPSLFVKKEITNKLERKGKRTTKECPGHPIKETINPNKVTVEDKILLIKSPRNKVKINKFKRTN